MERAGGEAEPGGAHCWRLLRRRVFVAALLTGGPVRLPSLRHALPASRHRCALAALGLDPGALGAPWPLSTGQGPGPQAGSLSLRLTLRARSHWRSRWIGGHLVSGTPKDLRWWAGSQPLVVLGRAPEEGRRPSGVPRAPSAGHGQARGSVGEPPQAAADLGSQGPRRRRFSGVGGAMPPPHTSTSRGPGFGRDDSAGFHSGNSGQELASDALGRNPIRGVGSPLSSAITGSLITRVTAVSPGTSGETHNPRPA